MTMLVMLLGGGNATSILQPSITSPSSGVSIATRTPTLTSSAFSALAGITHTSTDWQVSSDISFSAIVWQSVDDATNKTSITTGDLGGGARYTRVRYKGSNGAYSEWSSTVEFITPVTPVVSITGNINTTATVTAGGSLGFTVTAVDTANVNSTVTYQWFLSTNGGSSYSAISGATSNTLSRYSTTYFSDNSHKIFCRATATNSVGTNTKDSTVCTLTVNRNFDCQSSPITGSTRISIGGPKPSAVGSDSEWGSWSPGFNDICNIDGSVSVPARGRFCAWNMNMELRIARSTDGTKRHWGSDSKSGNQNEYKTFSINANGGEWVPESDGTPTFRLVLTDSGTECQNGAADIGAEQASDVSVNYSYRRRQYYFETRP